MPTSLYGPCRRLLTPTAAGISRTSHVALTFDDGPHPEATPRLLEILRRRGVRASFFLVGERAAKFPDVVERIAEGGHELAVHGWTHACAARVDPRRLEEDVVRTRDLLAQLSGSRIERYRPPYGIATVSSQRAASAAELRTVLWSAWGRDWSPRATTASIVVNVERTLRLGGTVLLHDCDAYGTPLSWRSTLHATEILLDRWQGAGIVVGSLREH